MSQDADADDVKPKLNLVINYERQRGSCRPWFLPLLTITRTEITVKVKPHMPFQKIFEVTEVCDIVVVACSVI